MKKIFVTRSSMPSMDEYIEEIRGIWDTCWLTNMGEKHQKFQKQLEERLSTGGGVELLVNGHMAIELTLQAMQLTGEVITTPFTFISTTHAVVRNGLKPVFCDVDPVTYTLDPAKIEACITDKTSAILPVHVYGHICNVDEIARIARKYGLKVIYDAAHTFGETYRGRSVADYGDASCLSFHATKVFHTIEGGAVVYHDKEFGEKLYNLKNFGIHGAECVEAVGANAKMNEFSAAMGLCNLRHLEEQIAMRKALALRYRERLADIPGVVLPPAQKDLVSNYAYFPVIFEEKQFGATRNEVCDALAAKGIYARKYFYPLTNAAECYVAQYGNADTPVALHLSNRVLTLPLYATLEMTVVDEICDIIRALRRDAM